MEAAESPTGWVVAKGKSLACPRGIIDEGQVIGVLDFESPEFFEARKKEGYIVAAPTEAKK